MTELLQRVIAELEKLPEDEQYNMRSFYWIRVQALMYCPTDKRVTDYGFVEEGKVSACYL